MAVNVDDRLYTCACGDSWKVEDMTKVNEDTFVHAFFEVTKLLNTFDLQEEGRALLKGIVVLSSGKIL